MRGGETLNDGSDNPIPNRNYPFGDGDPYKLAALDSPSGPADVATHPGDKSPYDVLDMTGVTGLSSLSQLGLSRRAK